jgi:predicted O-methyltransferase YrrM
MGDFKADLKTYIARRHPELLPRIQSVASNLRRLPGMRHLRRWRITRSYRGVAARQARKWVFATTEESNFLYDISEQSRADLALMLASFVDAPPHLVSQYFEEARNAELLGSAIEAHGLGPTVFPGRREAWYVLTRLLKPTTVLETGVADGLGALMLLSALRKNDGEGFPGRYVGVDITPGAGRWAANALGADDQFLLARSVEIAAYLDEDFMVDLLILDSDHDPAYEASELAILGRRLSERGVIVSDNCHVSAALREYSEQLSRRFLVWREAPVDHWYPGASFGLSLPG